MRLLLTNDDGFDGEGLAALVEALEGEHELWIVAPDSERSGASNAISLKTPSKVRKIGERRYSCSGMPADCTILGVLHILPARPDAVISGINKGPNLGTDLVYSGTAGAARQASIMGLPGIAVSLATREAPFLFGAAAEFLRSELSSLLSLWKPGVFINVNVPNLERPPLEYSMTSISSRSYDDRIREFTAPDGTMYLFLGEGNIQTVEEKGSDAWAVGLGLASVSVVDAVPRAEACPR
jgi:5'-nucleotidase